MYNFENHKYYDVEIRMYYLNSRYYNPEIGRFINADGLLGKVGELGSNNIYSYCSNNPIMFTDSTGHVPEWLVSAGLILAGILVGVGFAYLIFSSSLIFIPMLLNGTIFALSGSIGQMLSNKKHGSKIWKNVFGATVGGFLSGLAVWNPLGQLSAGFVNAVINEFENEWVHDDDPEIFNIEDVFFEGLLYSTGNVIASIIPPFVGQFTTWGLDYICFDVSDTYKDTITSNIRDAFSS